MGGHAEGTDVRASEGKKRYTKKERERGRESGKNEEREAKEGGKVQVFVNED